MEVTCLADGAGEQGSALGPPDGTLAPDAAAAPAGLSCSCPAAPHLKLTCHRILQGAWAVGQAECDGKGDQSPKNLSGSNSGALQIKTIMRYHLTPARVAVTKKNTNTKCWQGCGEKGTHTHCWWECKLVQPPWRTVRRCLKQLKTELPYDPSFPLLGIYIKKKKKSRKTNSKRYLHPNVHGSVI